MKLNDAAMGLAMSSERNWDTLFNAVNVLSQNSVLLTRILKRIKQEGNGESRNVFLHAPVFSTQSSVAADVIVIDDSDDEEDPSQGSVEQPETGRQFSGEASRGGVNPSSPFFLTSNPFHQGAPESNRKVAALIGYLEQCRDICASDPENNKDTTHRALSQVFIKSYQESDGKVPPRCRYPSTHGALIEYITFNTTGGDTHVVLVGAYAFLKHIRCVRNDLLITLSTCNSADRGCGSAEKAACVIVAASLNEKMRNKPRTKIFSLKDAEVPPGNDAMPAVDSPPGPFAFDVNRAAPPLEEATEEQALGGAGDEVHWLDLPPLAPPLLDYESLLDKEMNDFLNEMSMDQISNIRNGVLILNEDVPLEGETFPDFDWESEGDATYS
jgi:hypothetical protein